MWVITTAITVVLFNNSEINPTCTAGRCFSDCFSLPITVFYPAFLSTLKIMANLGNFSSLSCSQSCSHYLLKRRSQIACNRDLLSSWLLIPKREKFSKIPFLLLVQYKHSRLLKIISMKAMLIFVIIR